MRAQVPDLQPVMSLPAYTWWWTLRFPCQYDAGDEQHPLSPDMSQL